MRTRRRGRGTETRWRQKASLQGWKRTWTTPGGSQQWGERVVDDLREADAPRVGVRLRRHRIEHLWLIGGVAAAPLPFLLR